MIVPKNKKEEIRNIKSRLKGKKASALMKWKRIS